MNPQQSSTTNRYDERHARILQLKSAVGNNFWALGEELLRMQRECPQCGHLPAGAEFKGNNFKQGCWQCKHNKLGLYKIYHKRFEDYLRHARIHRQTAYRKIAVYETYRPLIPVISQLAPPEMWEIEGSEGLEARHSWAREYLSAIGWTTLEAIQKRVAAEHDEIQVIRIIEEASESSRDAQRAGGLPTTTSSPHQRELKLLRQSLNNISLALRNSQSQRAEAQLRVLSQHASRLAALIGHQVIYEISEESSTTSHEAVGTS